MSSSPFQLSTIPTRVWPTLIFKLGNYQNTLRTTMSRSYLHTKLRGDNVKTRESCSFHEMSSKRWDETRGSSCSSSCRWGLYKKPTKSKQPTTVVGVRPHITIQFNSPCLYLTWFPLRPNNRFRSGRSRSGNGAYWCSSNRKPGSTSSDGVSRCSCVGKITPYPIDWVSMDMLRRPIGALQGQRDSRGGVAVWG